MMTSPPRPPSPPEGPPRGTNFSRRKAMQPLPPSPALTRILASSTNMRNSSHRSVVRRPRLYASSPQIAIGRDQTALAPPGLNPPPTKVREDGGLTACFGQDLFPAPLNLVASNKKASRERGFFRDC